MTIQPTYPTTDPTDPLNPGSGCMACCSGTPMPTGTLYSVSTVSLD